MNRILFILLLLLMASCDLFQKNGSDRPLARVHEKFLYESDIVGLIPQGTSSEDSIKLVQGYVQGWIRQNLVIHLAELNLPDEQKDMQKQLEDYRNDLLIFAYEKELVRQKLDTSVSTSEIEEYYKENQRNFELKDYIVRVIYVKLEKNPPQLEKVRKWLRSGKDKDREALEEYCRRYAANFYTDTEAWLYFEDLLKEIPLKAYNWERFLRNNRFVELDDEQYIYLLGIIDYRLKNSISPLSLEKEQIRNILLNKRKLELINRMKNDIYQDALARNNFEIYEQEK